MDFSTQKRMNGVMQWWIFFLKTFCYFVESALRKQFSFFSALKVSAISPCNFLPIIWIFYATIKQIFVMEEMNLKMKEDLNNVMRIIIFYKNGSRNVAVSRRVEAMVAFNDLVLYSLFSPTCYNWSGVPSQKSCTSIRFSLHGLWQGMSTGLINNDAINDALQRAKEVGEVLSNSYFYFCLELNAFDVWTWISIFHEMKAVYYHSYMDFIHIHAFSIGLMQLSSFFWDGIDEYKCK